MIKVLHINSSNFGSTGTIVKNISEGTKEKYIHYFAYPKSRSNSKNQSDNHLVFGNIVSRMKHRFMRKVFDDQGFHSKVATIDLLSKIDRIQPSVIHLHNLHDSYINYHLLIDYINTNEIKVVWTFHDCWPFTGHCTHYTHAECYKWKSECSHCPLINDYPSSIIDNSNRNFNFKKKLFLSIKELYICTPSKWLKDQVEMSFFKGNKIKNIYNGIDLSIFKRTNTEFIGQKKILLGVASPWTEKKGIKTFYELADRINDDYKIILVGSNRYKIMHKRIEYIDYIQNKEELIKLYSNAHATLNLSVEESMGLVTIESLACGTPVIVVNSTASPELVNSKTGFVVQNIDVDGILNSLEKIKNIKSQDCIEEAKRFSIENMIKQYSDVYDSMINRYD